MHAMAITTLYLPKEWLKEQGRVPEAWLAHPASSPAIGWMIRYLLQMVAALSIQGAVVPSVSVADSGRSF